MLFKGIVVVIMVVMSFVFEDNVLEVVNSISILEFVYRFNRDLCFEIIFEILEV